jgi:hypothetical protein
MVKKTRSGKKLEQPEDLPIIDSADEDEDMREEQLPKSKKSVKKPKQKKDVSPEPKRAPLGSSFSKKRNFEAFSDGSDPLLSSSNVTGTSSIKKGNNDLWIVKYCPFDLDSHVIAKKKKEEFVQICKDDNRVKILMLQGPSGCGKNSLINCFGEQYNFEIVRYKDHKTKNVLDVYGTSATFGGSDDEMEQENQFYPDDLENLIYFIRNIIKASKGQKNTQPNIP